MSDQPTMPFGYTWLRAGNVALFPRPHRDFPVTALAVDLQGRAWIDPLAEPVSRTRQKDGTVTIDDKQWLVLDRVAPTADGDGGTAGGGFKADLSNCPDHWWEPVARRPERNGVPWIPVVEFVGFRVAEIPAEGA